MSTTAATGYCRVTIAAPGSRIDLALPEDLPLADLYPEVLRLSGQAPAEGAPVGYHLVRRDGTVLDSSRTLAAQRVLDGEVLALRPFADSLPPPVHDDVTDAVAEAVTHDRRLWDDQLLRLAGLAGAATLAALTAAVLWCVEPERHDMYGLPGVLAGVLALLMVSFAVVRIRVYGDGAAAVAFGLAALPHAFVAGTGVVPLNDGHGAGRLELLLGCVTVLVASAVLVAAMPDASGWFAATASGAAAGACATFGAIVVDVPALSAAAVCAPVALGALAFLPGLSASLARLPIGYTAPRGGHPVAASSDPQHQAPNPADDPVGGPVDVAGIAARARRGHQILLGLTGGCALLATGACGVLGFSGDGWAQLLALATGAALLTRARLFRYAVQVAVLLTAGLASLTLLILGVLDQPTSSGSAGLRTVWLAAALMVASALLAAVALIVPRVGLTPFWGRVFDLTEGTLLLSLVPLCLAVLDLYSRARSLTSG